MARLFDAWLTYHKANPGIYELFKKYTHEALGANYDKYSARTIIHRIRWHTLVETRSEDGFKIANAHSPYYARLYLFEHPHRAGVFQLNPASDAEAMGRWLENKQ